MEAWIAGVVFLVAYVLIAVEPFDRTLIALIAGLLVILLGVVDQDGALAAVDWSVILLLAGMMVIASILARTGLFEWVAIRAVRLSRGHPIRLMLLLAVATAILSAFLDNVTTVILTVPITLVVTRRLGISPVQYLIVQVLASNIGGTATLIGDPPNIMIGSAADLGFDSFLINLAPVAVIIFIATAMLMVAAFRSRLEVPTERREAAVEATEAATITDRPMLTRALIVTGATLVGFLFHSMLGLEPATIALLGATVMMVVCRVDPHAAFREVDWRTLFFFIGLFVLVESLVQAGIIAGVAQFFAERAAGDPALATVSLLWVSGGLSAIIDNIPYTATAIPVIEHFVAQGMPAEPLWWSLALGACLGGNLTLVGASANVVVANLALAAGHRIRFLEFLRYGAVVTVVSLLISTIYVWLRYLA
jgi:Na+/H+ antiporter NhaD/arsenite permease-like protein